MLPETQLQEVRVVIKELLFWHRHGELFDISVLQNMIVGDPVQQEDAIKLARYAVGCNFYTDTVVTFIDWLNYTHGFDIEYKEVGL